jgi:hypothetical protein
VTDGPDAAELVVVPAYRSDSSTIGQPRTRKWSVSGISTMSVPS